MKAEYRLLYCKSGEGIEKDVPVRLTVKCHIYRQIAGGEGVSVVEYEVRDMCNDVNIVHNYIVHFESGTLTMNSFGADAVESAVELYQTLGQRYGVIE